MANLTIALDDQLLQAARAKAAREGTSVNEICRQAVERFAGRDDSVEQMLATFKRIASQLKTVPDGGPVWAGRDALYREVMIERGLMKQGDLWVSDTPLKR